MTEYRPDREPRVTGYQLTNSVNVTVRDIDATGSVVDGALAAGATSLDGLGFRVEDPSVAEAEARAAAVADARSRAEALAAAAGVRWEWSPRSSRVERLPGPCRAGLPLRPSPRAPTRRSRAGPRTWSFRWSSRSRSAESAARAQHDVPAMSLPCPATGNLIRCAPRTLGAGRRPE